MLIHKKIILELERISVVEAPLNEKGKFVAYTFRMKYPSSYYFFKKPNNVGDKDFSIVWGQEPNVNFYRKDYKPIERLVTEAIKNDLPDGFKMGDVTSWELTISDYRSPVKDREWCVFYQAKTPMGSDRVYGVCQRNAKISKDAMAKIIAELPEIGDTDNVD